MSKTCLEVCCYNLESALIAAEFGADRIELCSNAYEGGTTPSYGLIKTVRQHLQIPISVMIRPRGGDFLYSPPEVEAMKHDIRVAKELGAAGVVFGCLMANGSLDKDIMMILCQEAHPLQITLHRAFDVAKDPFETLSQAIELGIDRILTSGQHTSVPAGQGLIKELITKADGKISIMPGAGINEQNLKSILEFTGATEFHVSAKGERPSSMEHQAPKVKMGHSEGSEYSIAVVEASRVVAFRAIADSFNKII